MNTIAYKYISNRDARITISRIFILVALLTCFVGTLLADIRSDDVLMLLPTYLVLAACGFIGLFVLRYKRHELLMFALLTLYIWAAYPLKLTFVINFPDSLWISDLFFPPKVIQKEISASFLTLVPGLVALFFGFLIGHKRTSQSGGNDQDVALKQKTLIIIILALIILRLFNQSVLSIGVPGVQPHVLPVPYLSGILEMLSRPVLFALVNLYFYSVLRLQERRGLKIASLLLFVNIMLGLHVGYKSELVFQGLLVLYYVFDLRKYMSKSRRKFVSLVAVLLVISMVTLYPIVNYYRNYLLSGQEISEAVDSAQTQAEKRQKGFFLSFYNRINGIGVYYLATKLGKGQTFPVSSLVSGNVMDLLKERLYGVNKRYATVAFGTTQFSVLYLVGGVVFLAIGSFIIGWFIRWVASVIRLRVFTFTGTFDAYLPLFCIFCIRFLSSGGQVSLYLKELALVVVSLYIIERICYVRKLQTVP